jgi:hypothetical protein
MITPKDTGTTEITDEHNPTATGNTKGILIQHINTVNIRRYPDLDANLKYKRYIRRTTQSAISANSTDMAYRCATINNDNITIVKPTGKNAHITDISIAITGLFSFSIYPMLAFSIMNETSATINFNAGTRYVSYLL